MDNEDRTTLAHLRGLTLTQVRGIYLPKIQLLLETATPTRMVTGDGIKRNTYYLMCDFLSDATVLVYKNSLYIWDGTLDWTGEPVLTNSFCVRGISIFGYIYAREDEDVHLLKQVRKCLRQNGYYF